MTAITPVKDVTGRIVKLFADQMNQGASLLIFTIVQQLQRNARRVAAENISTRALSTPLFPNKLSQQHALSIVRVTSSRSTSRKFQITVIRTLHLVVVIPCLLCFVRLVYRPRFLRGVFCHFSVYLYSI